MAPKITIITPSYNQGEFIEETILSVINQGYPNLEYIIIDGGSTDNTVEVIKKYQQHIKYWVSEKDAGQANAINKGLKIATGEIINWLNSDDVLLPGALAGVAQYFGRYPEAVIVHGRIQYFGAASYYSQNISKKDIETRYAAHICMPQPACFFKKQLIEEQGLLDENLHFSMDADLYVRAALHYPIVQVNDVFAKFRLHSLSKSVSSFNKTFLEDNKRIFSRVLSTLSASNEIQKLKELNLFVEPEYLYKPAAKPFNTPNLLFYFLEHRLLTLHSHGEKEAFRAIFSFLIKSRPGLTVRSKKIILYRCALFLPSGLVHSLAKILHKAAG